MRSKGVTPDEETYHLLGMDEEVMRKLYPFVSKLILDINEKSIPMHVTNMGVSINEERMSLMYVTKFVRRACHSVINDLMPLLSQVKAFSKGLEVEELRGMPVPNHIRFLYLLDLGVELIEAQSKLFMTPHVAD